MRHPVQQTGATTGARPGDTFAPSLSGHVSAICPVNVRSASNEINDLECHGVRFLSGKCPPRKLIGRLAYAQAHALARVVNTSQPPGPDTHPPKGGCVRSPVEGPEILSRVSNPGLRS